MSLTNGSWVREKNGEHWGVLVEFWPEGRALVLLESSGKLHDYCDFVVVEAVDLVPAFISTNDHHRQLLEASARSARQDPRVFAAQEWHDRDERIDP